jgi:hypothetical protein
LVSVVGGSATAAVLGMMLVLSWLWRGWRDEDARVALRNKLLADRARALAEGRIEDADFANRALAALKALALALTLAAAGGCATGKPEGFTGPLIVGQRVHLLDQGAQITVPDLIPPARQWLLMDDVAADRMFSEQ